MRKLYTIIAVLFIGNMILSAQPVLNQSDFLPITTYQQYSYEVDNIKGLSPGAAGANVTWDFSSLVGVLGDTRSTVTPASTPYASGFPTANYVIKHVDAYNLSNPYYEYFKASSTDLETVGSRDNSPEEYPEVDHTTMFKFPYTYTTKFTDTYQYMVNGSPEGNSFDATYDAYGTLKTPGGTYTNVMRQKRVEVDGAFTYTGYIWFTAAPFKIIMTMDFDESAGSSDNYTTFNSETKLGVAENVKENLFTVYPNPTSSVLNLDCANTITIDKVLVIDVTGRTVLQQVENTKQINVEKLTAGLYIVELYSGSNKFQSKFVKE